MTYCGGFATSKAEREGGAIAAAWPDTYERKTEIKSYSEIPAQMGTKIP